MDSNERTGAGRYDIVFVGHLSVDRIDPFGGSTRIEPGGAALFASMAASCVTGKIAVVTRIAGTEGYLLDPIRAAGIDVYVQDSNETTRMHVIHPGASVDERQMFQRVNAGFFLPEEMPFLQPCLMHLGGLTDREFTLPFMRWMKERGFRLSVDMQSFVRQVDEGTRSISFLDVPEKWEIMGMADLVKLDVVEAKILTGTDDLEEAGAICEARGSRETVITRSDGVLARKNKKNCFERFSNKNITGRTGRGDTTFGAYLAWRLDHCVEESLRFAASLASIKMETPGPFSGTLEDVIRRMELNG